MTPASATMRPLPLFLALLLATAGGASAVSFVPVSDEALVDRAPLAAVVRVTAVASGASASTVQAEVVELLKGDPGVAALSFEIPGGERAGRAVAAPGVPRFTPGERALVFLEPRPGASGTFRLHQLLLGAFHEVVGEKRSFAWRDFTGATALLPAAAPGGGVARVPEPHDLPRDFAAFARWVRERARGGRPKVDYLVRAADLGGAELSGKAVAAPGMRWFGFEQGGSVTFRARGAAPAAGRLAAFQAALAAWNDDPGTTIDLRFGGYEPSLPRPIVGDGESSLVAGDPEGYLTPFSCAFGGVLALTLPVYDSATTPFRDAPFHRLREADIVTNQGIDCFLSTGGEPQKATEELLAHELGHALGLAHACGDAASGPCAAGSSRDQALMRAQIHNDGRGARLSDDDRAAIAVLYGAAPPPPAPAALAATARSTTEVALSWRDNAGGQAAYRVEAKELGGSFAEVAVTPPAATEWVISGLKPATGYLFRVRAVAAAASTWSNEAGAATLGEVGPCLADERTLCLNGGRFRVRVSYAAALGTGFAVPGPAISDESGLLWFFSPGNWELALKVLDGCQVNRHYWVFFAALTDVEYTLTVTDSQTGLTRVYRKDSKNPELPVTDIDAFAVCP